ncbi:MAG: NAD(P)-dependent oxidoreductase [Chloroflexota bacterium]|nr:NAD(P)-dependent oxidoreductase [Chloroflexota bacterium]
MSEQRWRVLVGSKSFGQAFPEHLTQLATSGFEVMPNGVGGRAYHEDELYGALHGVHIIITGTDELTADVIARADSLRLIAKHGVGLETIALEAAKAKSVVVTSTPGAIHESVADLTLALLLTVARNIVPAHLATKAGGWKSGFGIELKDKQIGIIGLGRIGKGVALRAKGFGMMLTAYDPYPDEAFAVEHGVHFMELDELIATSDVVSLHAAAEQIGGVLINARRIALMKPNSIFINTARGSLVDETALAAALHAKRLYGAGLDAFVNEPPLGSPLLELDNVVLTPHIAGRTMDGLRRMGEITIENCCRVRDGQEALYRVV